MDFRLFYDKHVRFVWRALLRMGVPEREVPDAVQDVFVVVHRKLEEFEGRSKVTTWVFAIFIRVASDRRRLAHGRYEVLSGQVPEEESAEDDPLVLTDKRRARAALDAIVNMMPEDNRIVFLLFELEGMTGDEIAELLEVPVGTVRSRLRIARATFEPAVIRLRSRADASPVAALRPSEVL